MYDAHRPVYHLRPPKNWMNDPNGLIQHNGVYHAFYQHNPYGPLWGNMSWGHARSTDLVHWEHLPLAIAPDPGGPDEDGCYSGVMVVHENIPTMVYTGVRKPDELCCLAFPVDDDLVTWSKFEGNPVVHGTPPDLPVTIFRDHTLWREDETWHMGVGSGLEGRGGAVLLYQSTDLRNWTYLHPLAIEQPELNDGNRVVSTGWECPDYFFINRQPVLLACEWDGDPISSAWWRGEMNDHRFTATSKGLTDAGDALYAPQTLLTEDGRRLFFGWMRELRPDADQVAAGWSGVMSLPREVLLRDDGTIGFRPAAEIEQLRGEPQQHRLAHGSFETWAACEITVFCPLVTGSGVELRWGSHLAIRWDGTALHLSASDRTMAGSIPGDALDELSLRVFIDHSVVEVYLSDRIVMSTRVYADRAAWDRCTVVTDGISELDVTVWRIDSIW